MGTKKFTRQDAENILIELTKTGRDIVMNSGLVEPEKFVTFKSYIDAGQKMVASNCHACGHHWEYEGTTTVTYGRYGRVTMSKKCPMCGNERFTANRTNTNRNAELFVDECDNGFKFIIFERLTCFEDTPGSMEWMETDAHANVNLHYVGMFDKDYGWYTYDKSKEKMLKRDCLDEQHILKNLKSMTPINKTATPFSVYLAEAAAFEAQRDAKNAAKKANSKATVLEEMRQNYKPKEIDETKVLNASHAILSEVYSTKDNITTLMTYCTRCGSMHEVESQEGEIVCPDCGFSAPNVRYNYYYGRGSCGVGDTVVVVENTNLPENDMLMRVYRTRKSFSVENGFEQDVAECQRIFFGKKVNVYTRSYRYGCGLPDDKTKPFEKATIRDIDNELIGYNPNGKVIQDNEEIVRVIKNSCLMYSGLVESWGLGDKRYKGVETVPGLKYLMTWYKKPGIELIMKANMTSAMDYYLREVDRIGGNKSLADALQVAPTVAKMAAKLNLGYNQITDMSALYNSDNSLTPELFLRITNENLPAYQLSNLKTNYDIGYARALDYLQSAYDNQCIEKREALTLWHDYLRMATTLRIDLTMKERKYPASLKKEHDVATFAYRAVQVVIDKEKFAAQAAENAYYEYSYKDLVVVIPKTPQDIVEEATRQKNCLRSYVERVKNGDTVVAFIRRKIMPDATYVTAEVHNGRLTQLKGYCNSNPRNKELVEFVQHWAKAKGIRVEC